jgi:hypothetical protein
MGAVLEVEAGRISRLAVVELAKADVGARFIALGV